MLLRCHRRVSPPVYGLITTNNTPKGPTALLANNASQQPDQLRYSRSTSRARVPPQIPMANTVSLAKATVQDSFRYTPFADTHSVRILTLHPGSGSDPLTGHLTVEHLTSEPAYEAVSYVWGDGTRSSTLLLDSGALPLTSSIHDALVRLRLPSAPRRLWADQICINQTDIAERGQQVALMNAIYKNAQHILVWLGKDTEGVAAEAIRIVHRLNDIFTDDEAHAVFRKAHSEDLAQQDEAPWVPLSKLTKLSWFNRLWIVQEVGVGTPATLFWGDEEIDWEALSSMAAMLSEEYHHLRTRFAIYTPSIRYLYRRFVPPDEDYDEGHNRGSFVYELHRARHLLSKDPRDHVYAFLGHFSLAKSSAALADMAADYTRDVGDVYREVAVRVLKGAKSLLLLSACQTVLPRKKIPLGKDMTGSRLPSWVPDWRVLPRILLSSPETSHRAAGETTPRVDIDEQRHILHIIGRRIDTVARRSGIFYGGDFQLGRGRSGKRAARGSGRPLERLWRDVCGLGTSMDLERRYRDGTEEGDEGSAFFALVMTLVNGGIDKGKTKTQVPQREISLSEWLANGAAFAERSRDETQHPLLASTSSWSSTISTSSTLSTAPNSTTTEEDVEVAPAIHDMAQNGDAFKWGYGATLVTRHRRFAVTAGGYFLVGPDRMRDGDAVVVLYGGKAPFLLRPRNDGRGWVLLGECYVQGLMNGEALKGDGVDETFSIY